VHSATAEAALFINGRSIATQPNAIFIRKRTFLNAAFLAIAINKLSAKESAIVGWRKYNCHRFFPAESLCRGLSA
jgi:hypothetical protein